MNLGYVSRALAPSFAQAFEMAKKLGVGALQLTYFNQEDAEPLRSDGHADEIKAMMASAGVQVPSVGMSFVCRSPSLKSPQEAPQARELIVRGIDLASRIGASMVMVPFFGTSAIELQSEMGQAIAFLEDLVEPAEAANVVLGIESNLSFRDHRFLLDHFAYTNVMKVNYDTGNAKGRKLDLPTGIRDLGGGAIAGIHLKDVKVTEGLPPDFNVRLGQGSVDFQAVLQALRAVGYDGWLFLETPSGDDPFASAQADLAYARQLIGA